MPFEIVRNDLTNMKADAIVNAANPHPVIGRGVDSAVHKKAGERLLAARQKIGDIAFGDAAITPAFDLDAKYVIHAASPIWWDGTKNESALLENCYRKSLQLALEYRCESIAFPLLSTGNYGFPKDLGLQIAVQAFSKFLMQHEMQIYLVVFDKNTFALSEKLFRSIKSFVDENYIQDKFCEEYDITDRQNPFDLEQLQRRELLLERRDAIRDHSISTKMLIGGAPCIAQEEEAYFSETPRKLEDLMKEMEETFSESLIRIIDRKSLKDPDVYKKANIDRRLFSKIKNNKDYKPSKQICVAFAIALELNLDETRDLIGRAGYALTHSSKFDIIIEYFIRERNYNLFEINEVLFAFDQPSLGG